MSQMTACPDCGTPNRADADLCVQCWRELSAGVLAKIPAAAFATAAPVAAPSPFETAPPPPSPPQPRRVVAPRPAPVAAPEPVKPREAEAGPVPYFAPARGCATPPAGFTVPAQPSAAAAPTTSFPFGRLVALALVLAVLGGGYYFFFGKSGAFSPEDGAYSVTLPEGWDRVEEVEAMRSEIDVAVKGPGSQTSIIVGHMPAGPGFGKEQLRQGMGFVQQFMPKIPGLSMSPAQESALLGPDVTAFEMTATASSALAPSGGKVRMVFAAKDGSPHLAMMVATCEEADCPAADAALQKMAATFEFSS